ncbi:MAG: hypothetical protein LC795_02595 [Acidobacteria bacterium]|nr:hypothetical protein [Acidobacteriota bacterium]
MNPGDYRRDYAAYRSAVELARFEHHAGLSRAPGLRPLEDRYADLRTREAFTSLRRAHDETPAQFETERAGLRALAGAAAFWYAEAQAREVSEELLLCAESGTFDWGGARVRASESPRLLAAESDAARRGELARRWLDAVGACDDLRAARLEALGEAARTLGFAGRGALYEEFTGASLEALAASAEAFLRRTEAAYMTALSAWAARELPPGRAPEYADRFFFERAARTTTSFPARDFRDAYAATLAGLGVRAGSQPNLRVDEEPRAGKREDSACFAVAPPGDVRLVVGACAGGLEFQRRSFFEGGRAQVFAWASRESARRHPEFVHAPDTATGAGHGLLLSSLLREPAWLAARRGTRAAEAQEAARESALLDLYAARRGCASLLYALALGRAADPRSEGLAGEYASLYSGATGFRHDASTWLFDADAWFESATDLRARLFAASLREHLRARHGRRWYESRGAGEELIDVWNTASRYHAEELARLVWGGESGFELLADTSAAALDGRDG